MNSTLDTKNCVLVASDTLDKVEQWSALLRNASIPFEVRRLRDNHMPTSSKNADLNVNPDSVDRVRSIIREADEADEQFGEFSPTRNWHNSRQRG